jgi:hypothetical protein
MNVDALVLALVAIADMVLIVHLRRRRYRLQRQDRMMGSLRLALRWANRESRQRTEFAAIYDAGREARFPSIATTE